MGTAIRKNIPFVLHRPTTADLFQGTNVRMFNYAPVVPYDPLDPDAPDPGSPPLLDTSSHAAFGSAMALYLKMDKARRDEEVWHYC